jgi:hypothetical protein
VGFLYVRVAATDVELHFVLNLANFVLRIVWVIDARFASFEIPTQDSEDRYQCLSAPESVPHSLPALDQFGAH